MKIRAALLACCSALLLAPIALAADNQQQLRDRLKAAAVLSSLDDPALHQWHWKLEVTLYDKDRKNPTPATLEMWFRTGDMRTTATVGSDQVTILRKGDALYVTATDLKPIFSLALIQAQALHPIDDEVFQQTATESLNRQDNGTLHLDCIAPTLVKPTNATVSVGPPFSFCFLRDTPDLVATFGAGRRTLLRPRTGIFQSHQIPMELDLLSGKTKIAEARTTTLNTEPDDASVFAVTPDMAPFTGPVHQEQSQTGALQISGNPPAYPAQAKQSHLSGTVVFDAVIGKNGRITSLQPVGISPKALSDAARDAVSTWRYRPFQLNGLPFEVNTHITVNFALN